MAKPLCRANLSVGGPQTSSSAPDTLRSGLGVGSRSSRPELPWGWRVLVLPLLLCQLPAKSLWALTGSQGTEWPRITLCDWGSLTPPHPLLLVEFPGAKLLWEGKQVGPGPYSPGGLGCAGGQQDKNFFLRLHLEQEKVFPLGFYSSRKAGFYFCCLRQKILLGTDYPWQCRVGGWACTVLGIWAGLCFPSLSPGVGGSLDADFHKEMRRVWCP